jgi:hypothetical protein
MLLVGFSVGLVGLDRSSPRGHQVGSVAAFDVRPVILGITFSGITFSGITFSGNTFSGNILRGIVNVWLWLRCLGTRRRHRHAGRLRRHVLKGQVRRSLRNGCGRKQLGILGAGTGRFEGLIKSYAGFFETRARISAQRLQRVLCDLDLCPKLLDSHHEQLALGEGRPCDFSRPGAGPFRHRSGLGLRLFGNRPGSCLSLGNDMLCPVGCFPLQRLGRLPRTGEKLFLSVGSRLQREPERLFRLVCILHLCRELCDSPAQIGYFGLAGGDCGGYLAKMSVDRVRIVSTPIQVEFMACNALL